MSTAKNTLHADFKTIRRFYNKWRNTPDATEAALWLTDNYYLLSREYTSLNKTMLKNKFLSSSDMSQKIFSCCRDILVNGILPDENDIISRLAPLGFTVRTLQYLPFYFSFTVISLCADSLRTGNHPETVKNSVISLRNLGETDFDKILNAVSETEKILMLDPSGDYPNMDKATKERYRNAVSKTAKKNNKSEKTVAVEAYEKACSAPRESNHIGFYLDLDSSKPKIGTAVLISEIVLPLIICIAAGFIYKSFLVPLLLFFPVWEILKTPVNIISSFLSDTVPLPRMETDEKIPPNAKTAVSVSALLPSAPDAPELEKKLTSLYRSVPHENTLICLLADLKSNSSPVKASDDSDINAAKRIIKTLNDRYNGGFVMLIRPRIYSPTQREYSGFERKRGAIGALCSFICGDGNEFSHICGDEKALRQVKYLLALDYDTSVPAGALASLVSAAVHPLNRAKVSAKEKRVVSGCGIIAPKIETSISSASRTVFSKIMSPGSGVSAYNGLAGEKYQDLFSHSIFSGKGLIDVHAFNAVMPDRFPNQKILSHDILEGIVLRCAFAGDVSFTDSFPQNSRSFFARNHRWMRGDIQNIGFLFSRKKGFTDPGFSFVQKFQLFDNVRRAVTPIAAFVSLFVSCFTGGKLALFMSLISVLSVCAGELFSFIFTAVKSGILSFSRLYASDCIPFALSCLLRAAVSVMLLPYSFIDSLDAVVRTLYRMTVSKRNLLEWTTFASSDKAAFNIKSALKGAFAFISGVFFIWAAVSPGKIAGLGFVLAPLFCHFSGKIKIKKRRPISESERNTVVSYMSMTWNYYSKYCTPADNMLPPDNVQETPVFRISHRTSPTDIGLYAVSCLAARDMNIISSGELCSRIDGILNSIDKMEKYRGNLLNWYDTRTLKTLAPKYVSTVDSGNLVCCFVALKEGLYDYSREDRRFADIIKRLDSFIENCDLTFLYNKKRRLFHIGFDVSSEKLSPSYYDLFMSEARMTGYYACASGGVPLSHWGALGRMIVKDGRYAGPVSWTGTMFEYFMPSLFIPSYENTLQDEGLKFALRCQKRAAAKISVPYGVSESGYYSFDRDLNYLYKAHGTDSLSLKKTAPAETVISPYSTFISMEYDPAGALRNLKKLEDLGMRGESGFYEAADFTPGRTLAQDFAVVRSYMAHHAGMSIIACDNLLNNGIMRRRFMADENNAGAKSLLEEKIPTDIRIMKKITSVRPDQRPARRQNKKSISRPAGLNNITSVLSTNSELTMVTSSSGESVSVYAGRSVFKKCTANVTAPCGIFACVQCDDIKIPFTPAPDFTDAHSRIFSSTSGEAVFTTKSERLTLSDTRYVHTKYPAQVSSYSVRNTSASPQKAKFKLFFEPSLLTLNEFDSHPAYSALFLNAGYDGKNSSFIFSRAAHTADSTVYLVCGFINNTDFTFSLDREKVLPHPGGYTSLFSQPVRTGTVSTDKCCYVETEFTLSPGETKKLDFAFCVSYSRENAQETLSALRGEHRQKQRYAPYAFDSQSLSGIYAQQLMTNVFFSKQKQKTTAAAIRNNVLADDALWSFGISSDVPLICVKMTDDDNSVTPCVHICSVLSRLGIDVQLAVIASETDEYNAPAKNRLLNILQKENYLHMFSSNNGVFYINAGTTDNKRLIKLLASSDLTLPLSVSENTDAQNISAVRILSSNRIKNADNAFISDGFEINRTPEVPWCYILANPSFGTLVSESSLGFTWAMNSGENTITPWTPDSATDNYGERLYIKIGDSIFDVIKGSSAVFRKDSVSYSSSVRDLLIHTSVTVPPRGMMKNIRVSVTNSSDSPAEYELIYELSALLSADIRHSRFVKTKISDGHIIFSNPSNRFFKGYAGLYSDISSPVISAGTFSEQFPGLDGDPGNVSIRKRIRLPSRKTEIYNFYLSYGKTERAVSEVLNSSPKPRPSNEITAATPDKSLNMLINLFLPVQIIKSRLYGRTGFRQCSGAYGYRDQLQDALSVLLLDPSILRVQLYRCASAQFLQGDVFHWFHVLPYSSGARLLGSRTRYSDDLLWLPYCTAQYVLKTGDRSVLSVKLPFVSGEPLCENERQRCFESAFTKERETLYTHCIMAIDHALEFGDNGLPLIKGGDWNDSFNEVGINGKGESVWLGMFLIKILEDFSDICKSQNDTQRAAHYSEVRAKLIRNIEENAWEGDRYLRAFYDSGEPMGSKFSTSCKLDIISQAFSVLSGMPQSKRQPTALDTAYNELCDRENGIIKLFYPPFTRDSIRAGYVNDYPPGVRENGGQYTHAAVWLADAFFKLGDNERGGELINMINPAHKKTSVFKNEPYFLSADVYSAESMTGRGGWSMYTGSAGWFYSAVVENMLGLKLYSGSIKKEPCLPDAFRGSRADIKIGLNFSGGAYNPPVS